MIAKPQGMVSTFASVTLVGLALLVGVVWFLGTPGPVYACSCVAPGTPLEELEQFSAVFAGRVVSVQHSYDPKSGSVIRERDDRSTIGFEVDAVWKGAVHEDMYITTPPTGGSCGFTFIEGEEYIVYAYDSNYDDGGYSTGICTRTALLWRGARGPRRLRTRSSSSFRDGRTSARTTAGHGRGCRASPHRRLQAANLDSSPARWNRRSLHGSGTGPIGPRPTTQPTWNNFRLLKLTRRGS